MIRTFSGAGRLLSLRSLDGPEIDAYGEPISNIEDGPAARRSSVPPTPPSAGCRG